MAFKEISVADILGIKKNEVVTTLPIRLTHSPTTCRVLPFP